MENRQIDSKELGKYFIDEMLDNTTDIFEQGNVTSKDIETISKMNDQLADTMNLVNSEAFITFSSYSNELNKLAIEYYNNKIETHENFENFIYNCRKLHDEINNFISSK